MSKAGWLGVAGIWLVLLLFGLLGWRYVVQPVAEEAKKEELLLNTSSGTRFSEIITINLDSFSGYSILRSADFRDELGSVNIGLELIDDAGNYDRRLEDLQSGKCQMAAFTVDSLIKSSSNLEDLPGTIVFILDESQGADAMIGVSRVLPNVDAMNDPTTKFVVVPNSPSETLARVVMSQFRLDKIGKDPFIYAESARDVYDRYRKHKPEDKNIFVLWEPYVSKMSQNPDYKVIVDSSKFRGYILDVMVVNREFLNKNPVVVQQVAEAYFKASFRQRSSMQELISDDAQKIGEPIKDEEAKALAEKIWFKNTRENYGHYGLVRGTGLQHLEEVIKNITKVLVTTGGIPKDPTDGQPNLLYYDGVLSAMNAANFHPGRNISDNEEVRDVSKLIALSDEEWGRLEPVGSLDVEKLTFGRGSGVLTNSSKQTLDDLAESLKNWPQYYVQVNGNAGTKGDVEANQMLANERAKAAREYLIEKGIEPERLRAMPGELSGDTTVTFVVGQATY